MLIKHTIYYFLGKLAPALLSIIGVMLYTRLATPEQYGIFSLIMVIVGLLNILLFQWLRSSLLKFFNYKEEISKFNASLLFPYLILIIFVGLLVILFDFYFFEEELYLILAYMLFITLSSSEILIIIYQAQLKPKIIVFVKVLSNILIVTVSAVLLFMKMGAIGLLIGVVVGNLFNNIIFITLLKIDYRSISLSSDKSTILKFVTYGFPITFAAALSVGMQNIDKLMISIIIGFEANGNYAVSYDLIHNLIYMIMTSFSLAGLPLLFKITKEKGLEAARNEFKSYSKLLLFISVPICVGLVGVLNEFKDIVIGESYEIPQELLILIVLGTLFHGLKSYYFEVPLQLTGNTKYYLLPSLVAIVVNVLLNVYFLNLFGINGAALATTISFFIAMVISAYFSNKVFKMNFPISDFTKIIFSSGMMYLAIYKVSFTSSLLTLLVKIFIGIVVYFIVSLLINSTNMRTHSRNIFNKFKITLR